MPPLRIRQMYFIEPKLGNYCFTAAINGSSTFSSIICRIKTQNTLRNCEFTLITSMFPFHYFRMLFNKRLLSGSQSSHSNLSQASVTSDLLSADEADSPINAQHPKIAERRSNCSSDIQGEKKVVCTSLIV